MLRVVLSWIGTFIALWGLFYVGHHIAIKGMWYEIPFVLTGGLGLLALVGLSVYFIVKV